MLKELKKHFRLSVQALLALILLTFSVGCHSNKPSARRERPLTSAAAARLAQDMIGTWVHVGRPGQIEEVPTNGGRFKYRTGTHWVVIGVEPYTGLVKENFGGSYTMHGDEYVETQAYADQTWLHDNGKSFKFIVRIDGDTMTQLGVGNPYNEVWKRVKELPRAARPRQD
jgi:hypothetical protein